MTRSASNSALVPSSSDVVTRVIGRGDKLLPEARERLAALQRVGHRGVWLPDNIRLDPHGDVVARSPRAPGVDLSALVRTGGGLTAGECVAVGIDVAAALAALHSHGLSHGDVSPANVIVSSTGAVLVDLLGTSDERGTPGFASPERDLGATPSGDVYALGRVLMAVVAPSDRERIGAWAHPMCALAPDSRPSAAHVAVALRSCAEPVPVMLPELGAAAALRAWATVPSEATLKRPEGRPWRFRVRSLRVVASILGVGVAAAAFWLVTAASDPVVTEARPVALAVPPVRPTMMAARPGEAATALTVTRFDAIETEDALRLESTTLDGGPAHTGDAALAADLRAGAVEFDGLDVQVQSVEVLSANGDEATVRIVYVMSDYNVTRGEKVTHVATTTATADVTMAWTPGVGWQVTSARPLP